MRKFIVSWIVLVGLVCSSAAFAQQLKSEIVVQQGHTTTIKSIALSPDGKTFISASNDKTLILWDVESGKELRCFKGSSWFEMVVFSPDGKNVLSSGLADSITLWDINSGKVIKRFNSFHEPDVLAYSPNGKTFVSAMYNIYLRDIESGEVIRQFSGQNKLKSIDFSADGKQMVSGGEDETVMLWDVESGKLIKTFKGHSGIVTSVAFALDGKTIISGSEDKKLIKWDIVSGKKLKVLKCEDQVSSFAQSPDGKTVLLSICPNAILCNIEDFTKIKEFSVHYPLDKIVFTPDGKTALSLVPHTLTLWDVSLGKEIRTFTKSLSEIFSTKFTPDGKTASIGGCKHLDIAKGCLIKKGYDKGYDVFKSSPDGKIAISIYSTALVLWDTSNGQEIKRFTGHTKQINYAAFSPDGKTIISVAEDNTIKIWDIESDKEINSFTVNSGKVLSVSPDGKTIISGSDKTIIIWDIESGKEIRTYTGHTAEVRSAFFLPDGKHFISRSIYTGIENKLWNVDIQGEIKTNLNNIDGISSDGKYLISNYDYSGVSNIKFWDAKTWAELKTFIGHTASIQSVAFSPDGKTFASASADKTIKLWDIETGNNLKTFAGHTDWVNTVSFSPDGKNILSSSLDNTLKLWDVKSGELIYTAIASYFGSQWLVYNNEGYWDASPDGGDLVAMVQGMKVWSIDQFAVRNNRPDLILKNVPNANPELINHYYNQYQKRLKKLNLTEDKLTQSYETPETKITKTTQKEKSVIIDFTITSKTANIIRYNIFVNDVPIFGAYGKELSNAENTDKKSLTLTETIELITGDNKIEVSAMNENGAESYRALTSANYQPATPVKPNLYYIGFGVSKYKNAELNLQYADKDAKDLSDVFEKMKTSGHYANVYSKTYLNEEVTPESIKGAKDFLKNAKPDDTFILFIAGHGTHDTDKDATYYYVTSNADPNNLKGTAANFESIEDLLQGIPPRNKLFLMDACESGEIDEEEQGQMIAAATGAGISSRGFKTTSSQSTVNSQPSTKRTYLYQKDRYIYNDLVRRSGAIVFSSSKGGELSYERSDIENGLFTENIMKALTTSDADKDYNGTVSTDELREYVSAQVAKASGDLQHPTVDRDNIYQKFGFKMN